MGSLQLLYNANIFLRCIPVINEGYTTGREGGVSTMLGKKHCNHPKVWKMSFTCGFGFFCFLFFYFFTFWLRIQNSFLMAKLNGLARKVGGNWWFSFHHTPRHTECTWANLGLYCASVSASYGGRWAASEKSFWARERLPRVTPFDCKGIFQVIAYTSGRRRGCLNARLPGTGWSGGF